MTSRSTQFLLPVLALGFTALFAMGCDEHAPLRENANSQNTVLTQSKMQELAPSEGTFKGTMVMSSYNSINANHRCTLSIKRVIENVANPSTPTENVGKPKLTAALVCDEIMHAKHLARKEQEAALAQLRDLTDAMGVNTSVFVDSGDYNPTTKIITLPYFVSGYTQGNYGDISGVLTNDNHFQGTWYCRALGTTIATFDLVKQ